ncbi:class I SAM-dependent methyltransferase [Cupriavidus alkaliphilus]|uniref:class I SAM-dependent methyltransferase n=1 Tax=Cupriavidus alkaliphilus TaxID=942866 RepID=UPI001608C156|nr:class I SAM-dependent methyltransferase [Cupriavidus alkaliphilus]MBB3012025.1 putative O-methyltransferase YrrM [Cupriavidus alkaliphilus]
MFSQIKSMFREQGSEPDRIGSFFQNGKLLLDRLDALPEPMSFFPTGWMTPLELQVLYNAAKYGRGDFLEIGTWIGKSSTAIALGRRDAGDWRTRKYDAVDFGFVSLTDFCSALAVGMEYAAQDEIARPVLTPGGTMAVLMENLRSRGLLDTVTSVIRGNAADVPVRDHYGVVFCDATHNEAEIAVVGPMLSRALRPGSWLMCDDIHEHQHLVDALGKYVTFDFFHLLTHLDSQSKAAIGRVKATAAHKSR